MNIAVLVKGDIYVENIIKKDQNFPYILEFSFSENVEV